MKIHMQSILRFLAMIIALQSHSFAATSNLTFSPTGDSPLETIAGPVKQVAIGLHDLWSVDSNDGIFRHDGDNWTRIPGALKQIAVGTNRGGVGGNVVWGVNSADQIYRYNGNNTWTLIPGSLKQVSVGAYGEVWGVNSADQIYRYNGNNTWTQIPGGLKHVSVGGNGEVWGVNRADQIYRYNGNNRWTLISGSLKQVSVGGNGEVWGVNSANQIYRYNGNNTWTFIPGSLTQVSAGPDGAVWGVNMAAQAVNLVRGTKTAPVVNDFVGRSLYFKNVSMNGGGSVVTVNPGEKIDFSASWKVDTKAASPFSSFYCPYCIVQFYYGIAQNSSTCIASQVMQQGMEISGSTRTSFVAPMEPGVYFINTNGSLQYSCQANQIFSKEEGNHIGIVVVRDILSGVQKHTNDLYFDMTGIHELSFDVKKSMVTAGQPYDRVSDNDPKAVVTAKVGLVDGTKKRGILTLNAGRQASPEVAEFFNSKSRTGLRINMKSSSANPGVLNFAFEGDITFTRDGGEEITCRDIVIGQGHGSHNDWWLSSKHMHGGKIKKDYGPFSFGAVVGSLVCHKKVGLLELPIVVSFGGVTGTTGNSHEFVAYVPVDLIIPPFETVTQ